MAKPVEKGLPLVNSFASIPSLMRQVGFRDCSLVVCGFCAACRHIFSVPDCTKTWCHNWRYEICLIVPFYPVVWSWKLWMGVPVCFVCANEYVTGIWNWGGIENINHRNVTYCYWYYVEKRDVPLPILCV